MSCFLLFRIFATIIEGEQYHDRGWHPDLLVDNPMFQGMIFHSFFIRGGVRKLRISDKSGILPLHEFTYRCPKRCPIGKHCFIIKVPEVISEPMTVLYKCPEKKADIRIVIGGPQPP